MTREEIAERVAGCGVIQTMVIVRGMIDQGELTEEELFSLYGLTLADVTIPTIKD